MQSAVAALSLESKRIESQRCCCPRIGIESNRCERGHAIPTCSLAPAWAYPSSGSTAAMPNRHVSKPILRAASVARISSTSATFRDARPALDVQADAGASCGHYPWRILSTLSPVDFKTSRGPAQLVVVLRRAAHVHTHARHHANPCDAPTRTQSTATPRARTHRIESGRLRRCLRIESN